MKLSTVQFNIPEETSIDSLLSCLRAHFNVQDSPPLSVKRVFFDTFDWRIFSKNWQFTSQVSHNHHNYSLCKLTDGKILGTLSSDRALQFIWDFPTGSVKSRLAPVIEMRLLQPTVSVRCNIRPFAILNDDEKTVARVSIEEARLLKNSGSLLAHRIILQPIKGYQKPYHKLLALLSDEQQLPVSENDVYTKALIALKKQPGSYSPKLNIPLSAQMRADTATKTILLYLLNTMQQNEDGTIENLDTEFLHDFRVAVRRTRSALTQIKHVLPSATVERYKKEFTWLGTITSPTRDLDVYLLNFDEYKRNVPQSLQPALEPLHEFLQAQQIVEQKKLCKTLRSARYKRLKENWRKCLQSPAPKRTSLSNAPRPIIDVARERTWRMYKRVLKEGNAIDDDSPADDVHELRKSCKKLRYLMEFFHSLYPKEKISVLIKALKQLQNNLGDYNDLHVQIESLQRFSMQMDENTHPPAETLLAIGTLIEGLNNRQLAVRQEFYDRYNTFSAPEYKKLFKELFAAVQSQAAETA